MSIPSYEELIILTIPRYGNRTMQIIVDDELKKLTEEMQDEELRNHGLNPDSVREIGRRNGVTVFQILQLFQPISVSIEKEELIEEMNNTLCTQENIEQYIKRLKRTIKYSKNQMEITALRKELNTAHIKLKRRNRYV